MLYLLILPLTCVGYPTQAIVKKKPARAASPKSSKPAHPSRHPNAKPHNPTRHPTPTRSKSRHQPPTRTYISPALGTAAAESAQETLAQTPAAPFLYPHNLDPFFKALAAQQAETPTPGEPAATIRVLQFGDSHTAADLFTGELRAQLQSRFGNGGLGFQFPGHPFAGYRLAGSTRSQTSGWFTEGNRFTQLGDGDLGLGGIAISTSRPGESVSLSTTCTVLQVQYLQQPGGGHLRFTDNGAYISDIDTAALDAAARSGATLTYACTPGAHDFQLTTLDHAPVRLLGLVTEQPGITWECLGINGAVAALMLRWNQEIFASYLRERDPSLIVLAYGTNEAAQGPTHNEEYVTDLNRLLENLHRIAPAAAILVLGPYDRATRVGRGRRASWQTFPGTERIIAGQKQACRLHQCAFYDQRARQGGPGAMLRWVSAGLAQPDRTHLTGTGYRALADALSRDLLAAYTSFQPTTPTGVKADSQ